MGTAGFGRVRPVHLELLAVLAGVLLGGFAGRPAGLVAIFVGSVAAGWWRSWHACLLAALFAAGMTPFAMLVLHGWYPLQGPVKVLAVGLGGAAIGAWARRFGPAPPVEERGRAAAASVAVAADRKREGRLLVAWGVGLLLFPVVFVFVVGGGPAVAVLYTGMIMIAWPLGVLLTLLGAVRWWRG